MWTMIRAGRKWLPGVTDARVLGGKLGLPLVSGQSEHGRDKASQVWGSDMMNRTP